MLTALQAKRILQDVNIFSNIIAALGKDSKTSKYNTFKKIVTVVINVGK